MDINHVDIAFVQTFLKHGTAGSLKATQKKLSYPKLIRNLYDIATGKQAPYIEVAGDLIIDGHHRYIAGKIAGILPQQAPGVATHATVVIPWQHVVVEDDDWDFPVLG